MVEHFLLSRAHIGSNFDQFLKKKMQKSSQLQSSFEKDLMEHSFITFCSHGILQFFSTDWLKGRDI